MVSANKLNTNYDDDLNKQVEKFWSVESYETLKPYEKEIMTKEEKRAIKRDNNNKDRKPLRNWTSLEKEQSYSKL